MDKYSIIATAILALVALVVFIIFRVTSPNSKAVKLNVKFSKHGLEIDIKTTEKSTPSKK